MRILPQESHADLGLDPEADKTPDLRPGKGNAPGAAATASEGENNHAAHNYEKEF